MLDQTLVLSLLDIGNISNILSLKDCWLSYGLPQPRNVNGDCTALMLIFFKHTYWQCAVYAHLERSHLAWVIVVKCNLDHLFGNILPARTNHQFFEFFNPLVVSLGQHQWRIVSITLDSHLDWTTTLLWFRHFYPFGKFAPLYCNLAFFPILLFQRGGGSRNFYKPTAPLPPHQKRCPTIELALNITLVVSIGATEWLERPEREMMGGKAPERAKGRQREGGSLPAIPDTLIYMLKGYLDLSENSQSLISSLGRKPAL